MDLLKEIAALRDAWQKLKESGRMTKATICELVIPFRDRHGLTDVDALEIAKGNMSQSEMVRKLQEGKRNG